MEIKIELEEEVDEKIWYAGKNGETFPFIAQDFTHYIVQAPHKKTVRLMGVLKRHGKIIDSEDISE